MCMEIGLFALDRAKLGDPDKLCWEPFPSGKLTADLLFFWYLPEILIYNLGGEIAAV